MGEQGTTGRLDFGALRSAIERGAPNSMLEFYADDAGVRVLDGDALVFEVEGKAEVAKYLRTVHERPAVHRVENEVLAEERIFFHNFHNATDEPTTFLIELRPGSSGFEKALRVAYGLASDGLSNSKGLPKNLYHTALLFEWGEGRLPGIFALLEPVFGFLARRARRKGIDRELEERYAR